MDGAGPWDAFFTRVKQRPQPFYQKCATRLENQDLYEPSDLADLDEEVFVTQLTGSDATTGEITFLRQAVELAKGEAGVKPKLAAVEASEGYSGMAEALSSERAKSAGLEATLQDAQTRMRAMEAQLRSAEARASTPQNGTAASVNVAAANSDAEPFPPSFPVASVIIPGNEDPKALLARGGLELEWTGGIKVTKFREKPIPRIVDSSLCLPNLYLHFLDADFLPPPGTAAVFDNALRSGNDNAELQIVLPEKFTCRLPAGGIDTGLANNLDVVLGFTKHHAEVEISSLKQKSGGFSPLGNYTGSAKPQKLYFSLKTARPKAPINIDKAAFGIPDGADVYLFAQNHSSVEHLTPAEHEAFQACIAELPDSPNADLRKLATFLKIFYEGGFAYNHKEVCGAGYIPRNKGIAGLGVVPAFGGQGCIATGYPYLLESSFLRFTDTVPVTIPAVSAMSKRHGRYGLCFTRLAFVWEDEAFQRERVLNYCSLIPHGGFYYVPEQFNDHRRLGGLIYAFGGEKKELEVPVEIAGQAGASSARPGSAIPAAVRPADDHRVCVVCLTENAVMATVPCGHRAYCANCAPLAKNRNCPVCRQRVTDLLRVY